jgi:hypothetical protein
MPEQTIWISSSHCFACERLKSRKSGVYVGLSDFRVDVVSGVVNALFY